MDRYWAWDEAVYVSQVSGAAPPAFFGAHRARGISALVLPVTAVTHSIMALRVYLVVLGGFAMFLAYRPWLRVLTPAAVPLAALLYSVSWIALFYGSEVAPNPWVALGAVAAAGFGAQALWGRATRRSEVAAGLAVCFVALMRPPDSLWLAVPLGVAALVAGRRGWRLAGALLAGGVVGWLPWILEAFERFGGPVARVRTAAASARTDTFVNAALHLRLSDGGLSCCFGRFREPVIPVEAVVWWVFFIGFALVAVLACAGPARRGAILASATAVALGSTYLFFTQFVYVRFLLPAYAMASVAAAAGIVVVYEGPAGRGWGAGRLGVLFGVSLVLSWIGYWHLTVLDGLTESDPANREVALAVADQVRDLGVLPQPCFVVGTRAPQIAYALGCRSPGINRRAQLRNEAALLRRQAQGESVAAFWRFAPDDDSFAHDWRAVPLRDVGQRGWRMYLPPQRAQPRLPETSP